MNDIMSLDNIFLLSGKNTPSKNNNFKKFYQKFRKTNYPTKPLIKKMLPTTDFHYYHQNYLHLTPINHFYSQNVLLEQ